MTKYPNRYPNRYMINLNDEVKEIIFALLITLVFPIVIFLIYPNKMISFYNVINCWAFWFLVFVDIHIIKRLLLL